MSFNVLKVSSMEYWAPIPNTGILTLSETYLILCSCIGQIDMVREVASAFSHGSKYRMCGRPSIVQCSAALRVTADTFGR